MFGDILTRVLAGAFGIYYYSSGPNFLKGIEEATRGASDVLVDGFETKDVMETLKGLSKVLGLYEPAITGAVEGVEEINEGNIDDGALRVLGWPNSVLDMKEKTKKKVADF